MGSKKKKRREELKNFQKRFGDIDTEKMNKIKKNIEKKKDKGMHMEKYVRSLAKKEAMQDFIEIQDLKELKKKRMESGKDIQKVNEEIRNKEKEFQQDIKSLSREEKQKISEIEEKYPERMEELVERARKVKEETESDLGKALDKAFEKAENRKKKEEESTEMLYR